MYNDLARYICRVRPSVAQIRQKLSDIAQSRKRTWVDAVGYFVSAGALAVFFGGGLRDALASGKDTKAPL